MKVTNEFLHSDSLGLLVEYLGVLNILTSLERSRIGIFMKTLVNMINLGGWSDARTDWYYKKDVETVLDNYKTPKNNFILIKDMILING